VLAFQLLQSGNAFKDEYLHKTEIYALECGLDLMKTVLNDVLDFESKKLHLSLTLMLTFSKKWTLDILVGSLKLVQFCL
jgi:hypothetical protein